MAYLAAADHRRNRPNTPWRGFGCALLALGLVLGCSTALAGSSGGAASLLMQTGSGAPLSQGDYVSSSATGGLNTYYSYFIEVPPGTASLQVDVFDLDLGTQNRVVTTVDIEGHLAFGFEFRALADCDLSLLDAGCLHTGEIDLPIGMAEGSAINMKRGINFKKGQSKLSSR